MCPARSPARVNMSVPPGVRHRLQLAPGLRVHAGQRAEAAAVEASRPSRPAPRSRRSGTPGSSSRGRGRSRSGAADRSASSGGAASTRRATGRARCRPSSSCRRTARSRWRRRCRRSPGRPPAPFRDQIAESLALHVLGTMIVVPVRAERVPDVRDPAGLLGHRHDMSLVRRCVADVAAGGREHEPARHVERRGDLLVCRIAGDRRRPEHLAVGEPELADAPVGRRRVHRGPIGRERPGVEFVICAEPGEPRVRRRREPPEHLARVRVDASVFP